MSLADLEKFVELAADSETLSVALAAEPTADAAVRLGAEHGCDFTAAEAQQLFAAMQAEEGELSEADLAAVAGGIGTWPTPEHTKLKASFAQLKTAVAGSGGFSW